MADTPVLDPQVIETLRQLTPPGAPDVLTEVLRLFLREVPVRIELLRNAWTAGDIPGMYRAAHSLKGSAGNIGAQRLYAVARQLDDRGRAGDLAGSAPLVAALVAEFDKVEVEIHRLIGAGGQQSLTGV